MITATRRPKWLNKKITLKDCHKMKAMLKDMGLHTVCQEAACPNISECFAKRTATFMILGNVCTRNCRFCNLKKGTPDGVDWGEPERVAQAVEGLDLKHAVITSVTRDDIGDGGAEVFSRAISAVRKRSNRSSIEVLIPDFNGKEESIERVAAAGPDIINHNIETVSRLYKELRPEADYRRSLDVLKMAKGLSKRRAVYTKSGLMLGLGENEEEILEVFSDLRNTGCDLLSIGQYLAPSRDHYPVQEYVGPDRFEYYKEQALRRGFLHVASAPYVRSSYCATEYLERK